MNTRLLQVGGIVLLTFALAIPAGAAIGLERAIEASDGRAPLSNPGKPVVAADGGIEWVVDVRSLAGIGEGDRFHGAPVLWTHASEDGLMSFLVASVRDQRGFEQAVLQDGNVRAASVNREVGLHAVPNDPCYNGTGCSFSQYGPQLIGSANAWDTTYGTTASKIAVVDTGLNFNHVEFSGGRVVASKNCSSGSSANDGNGHGTHTAGSAGANTNNGAGIAGMSQSALVIARSLNNQGSGSDASVACGVDFGRTQGSHVISMSLGCAAGCVLSQTKTAIQNAWNGGNGALVSVSSGNDGCVGNNCVGFPANMPEATAVGCVTSTKARCSFSNGGPELDLVAPGNAIWSTWKPCQGSNNCYASISGTSMSAPHVSGAAGLVKSANTGFNGASLRSRLIGTAEDLGSAGFDHSFGNGMVRADNAVP